MSSDIFMCLYNNDDDDNSNINNNNNSIVIIIIMILRNNSQLLFFEINFRWIVAEHSAVINLQIHYSPIVLVYTY